MNFGDNLKYLRKSKKLSQESLAEKMNVSRQSVSKWETGEAYPEMNNILELCKIFKCRINDLVNDSIIDIESLDEDTKKEIVKLKNDEQKKIKGISKAISIIAKIGNIACKIAIPFIILMIIGVPFVLSNIKVSDNEIVWSGDNTSFKIENNNDKVTFKYKDILIAEEDINTVDTTYIEVMNNNSKYAIIGYLEVGFIVLLIIVIIFIYIFKYLEKLFNNINKGETPFTLENTEYLSNIAWLMIIAILLPNICGATFSGILNIDIDFEIFDLVEVLFLFSMVYIFKYGCMLQRDSKCIMYGNEDE